MWPQPAQHNHSVFFFDILHLDGVDLLDESTHARLAALDAIVPADQRVDRLATTDAAAAQRFLDVTLAAGHEGVMAKSPASLRGGPPWCGLAEGQAGAHP